MDPNEIYYRSLYNHGRGHPVFTPEPDNNLPAPLDTTGIVIGDVGVWNEDGSFGVLFNSCQPPTHIANRQGVPEGFEPLSLREDLLQEIFDVQRSAITNTQVEKTDIESGFSFLCFSRGGVLVLPHGASRVDWIQCQDDIRMFVIRTAEKWRTFVSTDLGRRASSLFMVTGCDKTTAWALASFSDPPDFCMLSLKYNDCNKSETKWSYEWEGCTPAAVRFSANHGHLLENQCIFLRGFTLTFRDTETDDEYKDDEPYNMSVIINNWLLDLMPEASVAIIHDNDWRDIVKEADQIPLDDEELLRRVHEIYEPMIVSGGVFLTPRSPTRQNEPDSRVALTHLTSHEDRKYGPQSTGRNLTTYIKASIEVFTRAIDIPPNVWKALETRPCDSNVILPQALKSLAEEKSGDLNARDQAWIACGSRETIDLILSATDGPLGQYPIFIVSTRPVADLTNEFLLPRLTDLVNALRENVPVNRVFSVFAPEPIAKLFVSLWADATGVGNYTNEPYYEAKLSYCSRRSLVNRQMGVHPDLVYDLRPAVGEDIMDVAELFHAFAAESDPYVLAPDQAIEEATILISKGQVWVHRVCELGGTGSAIASIVAFPRNTDTVATITKVFTNTKYRRRGCAERLIRRVCKHLLLTVESVTLFVSSDSPGFAKMLARVGFVGLVENSPPIDALDHWLEIGLDRAKVTLGHW